MKMVDIAFRIRAHVLVQTEIKIKATHIYEAIACGFGFHTYANLRKVVASGPDAMRTCYLQDGLLRNRLVELLGVGGYDRHALEKSFIDALKATGFTFDEWVAEIKRDLEKK